MPYLAETIVVTEGKGEFRVGKGQRCMSDGFADIAPPIERPNTVSAEQIAHGPPIPPQQRILLYSAEEWERFIEEWAHFDLKSVYIQVQRFSGSGDRGIDIAGFTDGQK